MATAITKTPSELDVSFDGYQIDQASGRIGLQFTLRNPSNKSGSLGILQYSTDAGSTWRDCQRVADPNLDITSIPFSGKPKTIGLVWSAIDDLWIHQAYTDVQVQATFYDRESQIGAVTDPVSITIAEIDFTPNEITVVEMPLDVDPYLNFLFRNAAIIRQCRLHFQLAVDTVQTFDSGSQVEKDSSVSQTNWEEDGGAFPAAGTKGHEVHTIGNDDPDFDALTNGDYYWRIQRSVVDSNFHVALDAPGQYDVTPATFTMNFSGQIEVD